MKFSHNCLYKFLDLSGVNRLFRFLNRNKVLILWYHGICDDNFRLLSNYDERHVQKSNFRKQLIFLKNKGYNFCTMSGLVDSFKNKKKIKKKVVITFDDGYRNVITNAYPIMREFNAKGCLYLVSDLIDSDKLLWTDYIETIIRSSSKGDFEFLFENKKIHYILDDSKSYENAMQDIKCKLRMLPDDERINHLKQFSDKVITDFPKEFILVNRKEIQSLDKKILEIGSHTKSHPNLTKVISSKDIEAEIKSSKDKIQKMVGHEVSHFCYPAGDYNEDVIKKVIEAGYKSAVTITHGFNNETTDLYQLKRIEAKEDFQLFKSTISGSHIFLYQIKEFITRKRSIQ